MGALVYAPSSLSLFGDVCAALLVLAVSVGLLTLAFGLRGVR